ncbi:hypothetical protein BHE74_00036120 [Ensete ventricosum]|nr:hypothetical protein BHE74_00036120 [Ensete ventricosum]
MHRVDAFGNSPGVCWKLVEGIRSLLGWRKRVRQKKTETRRKIIGGCQSMRDRRKSQAGIRINPVGRRGGRPLAGRLPATKGRDRLRRGSDGDNAVRVKEG